MPASAAVGAMLCARSYQVRGGALRLAAFAALLIVALFNNEGATLLTLLAVPAAIIANRRQRGAAEAALNAPRMKRVMTIFAAVAAIFLATAMAWRLTHPSGYAGTALAPFDAVRIATTLANFLLSGTIFYDVVHPNVQNYADALTGVGGTVEYVPSAFLRAGAVDAACLMTGGLTALLMMRSFRGVSVSAAAAASIAELIAGLLAGAAIATAPLLPVAMTIQYRDWFYRYDEHVHSHTIFATFGLALMAALLLRLPARALRTRPTLRAGYVGCVAFGFGVLAMTGSRMNDAIARDIVSVRSRHC